MNLRCFSWCSDGLYVLLRPEKKKDSATKATRNNKRKRCEERDSVVPFHLSHFVASEFQQHDETSSAFCQWNISGPQYPAKPNDLQQRYCYPKGSPTYSNGKGGALWTMYNKDSREILDYRIFHVYSSAKRALNQTSASNVSNQPKRQPPKSSATNTSCTLQSTKSKQQRSKFPNSCLAPEELPKSVATNTPSKSKQQRSMFPHRRLTPEEPPKSSSTNKSRTPQSPNSKKKRAKFPKCRLAPDDATAILESLRGGKRLPPKRLPFKIIPVGPKGFKLSPPPYEFDGK
jgi:hypothetical protein